MDTQLNLFISQGRPVPMGRRRLGRNDRLALRLDEIADLAEAEAGQERARGDQIGERRALEGARDARRSAALLRAGPRGVARVLGEGRQAA
jgi:hypothetical protein